MRILILAVGLLVSLPYAAVAQDNVTPQKQAAPTAEAPRSVNADELGVSIDRIRLNFRRTKILDNVFDPAKMKLSTYVDVVAKAPPIRLFGPDAKQELTSRAVPFGGPTHKDLLQIMTPQEFRTPPMDLMALINWLNQQLSKKTDEN